MVSITVVLLHRRQRYPEADYILIHYFVIKTLQIDKSTKETPRPLTTVYSSQDFFKHKTKSLQVKILTGLVQFIYIVFLWSH